MITWNCKLSEVYLFRSSDGPWAAPAVSNAAGMYHGPRWHRDILSGKATDQTGRQRVEYNFLSSRTFLEVYGGKTQRYTVKHKK